MSVQVAPADVKPQWLSVIRRLQSALSGNRGNAIVSINVLVDAESVPRLWTEPVVKRIEPKVVNFEELLSVLMH